VLASELPYYGQKSKDAEAIRMQNLEADHTINHTIDESHAAALLGLTLNDLRWFSRSLGLGHQENAGNITHTFFTYEELKKLSSEAAASTK
jgi:hypothetical protein